MRRSDPLSNAKPLIRRVYAYVAYRLGDGELAEDVTSETFLRAVRYRASYDRSKGEPIAWLLGIAKRCVDAALARPAEIPVADPETLGEGDLEERTVGRLALAAALTELSARDRELIALRFGADLTARQIGERLEMKTNAVEVALHRALDRLRSRLEGFEEKGVRVSVTAAIPQFERSTGSTGEAL